MSLVVKILKSAREQTAGNRGKTAMALISFVPLTDKPESLRAPEKEAPAQKTVLRYVKLLARQEWGKKKGQQKRNTQSWPLIRLFTPTALDLILTQNCLKEWQVTMFERSLILVSWASNIYLYKFIFLLYLIL